MRAGTRHCGQRQPAGRYTAPGPGAAVLRAFRAGIPVSRTGAPAIVRQALPVLRTASSQPSSAASEILTVSSSALSDMALSTSLSSACANRSGAQVSSTVSRDRRSTDLRPGWTPGSPPHNAAPVRTGLWFPIPQRQWTLPAGWPHSWPARWRSGGPRLRAPAPDNCANRRSRFWLARLSSEDRVIASGVFNSCDSLPARVCRYWL